MSAWLTEGGFWLLLQSGTLPDTIITRQITDDPGTFQKITSVTTWLMSLTILVLTAALVPAAWSFRKSYKRINELLDKVYGDINPIMRHASTIADNVDYVTTSLRADVQQVNQTVTMANQRVLQAVRQTERRIREFNALLDVVQQEAETAFVSTASTVRGVRAGAEQYQAELQAAGATERLAHLDDELADALEDVFDENGEEDDGIDDRDRGPRAPEPRIRPRGHA